MKRIVIVGAGGLAREIKALIGDLNRLKPRWEFAGYVVTDMTKLTDRDSRDEVVGDYQWLRANADRVNAVTIGIGTPAVRLKVSEEIKQLLPDIEFPALIHPTAHMDFETAQIGNGVIICAGVLGTVNIALDDFALCNLGCTIGHESRIGRGSVINPGVNISGGVTLGCGVLIGTGAQILQYITVGDHATVGAGAVVTRDVASAITVVGSPAKPLALHCQ